ncbi:MAG: TonB-dependent receptor [Bacteroidales bacterium]|nr:TonB-dependent receptor [Bacteroidales bacterium]
MKLTMVLFFLAITKLMASEAYSQTTKLTLQLKDATVKEALNKIEDNSEFFFLYNSKLVDVNRKVSMDVNDKKINEILGDLFEGTDVVYAVVDRQIVLTNKANQNGFSQPVDQQQQKVTGKVTNESGEPLPGVSVIVKGTTTGTITDINGSFSLANISENATLQLSFVGMKTLEVKVGNQTSIDAVLADEMLGLDEVVVIGYGSVKKTDLTGSVTQIKPKDLAAFTNGNILKALSGRATGVQVLQNDGRPGASPSIRIRGTNSILGSNEPLYVIDGFPGSISSVQETDIESIEILKDASATAIYGSRGANGVIIISTKKGKSGETLVDYETNYGMQRVTKKLDLMNGLQWAKFYNEVAVNDGANPYFTNEQLDAFAKGTDTDWQDLILYDAPIMLHSLNVSGGNEKTQFSISGNAFLQDGIIKNTDYNRYTLRSNINHKISKIFSISLNALASKTKSDTKSTEGTRGNGVIGGMIGASPVFSPFNIDGTISRINTAYPFLSNVLINPLTVIYGQSNKSDTNFQLFNLAFDISPIKGMVIKLAGGVQNSDSRSDSFTQIDQIINSVGSASVSTSNSINMLNENTISYSKTFGDHSISAVGGFSYEDSQYKSLSASGKGFLSNVVETYNLQGAASQGIASSGYSKAVLFSYLGRVNYNYKGRYFATFSYRRDGSSKFSVLNKWSDFPSGAIAWRVSEEKFMQQVKTISNLKLRASYGAAGNNALSAYQTLNALGSYKVVFNDALFTAFGPGTTKPGQLKWETTYGYDAGVDLGLFSNRINITIDYYHKKTKDLLNSVQLPASSGYTQTLQNVGEIQNKGFEFSIDAQILNKEVKWNVSSNISVNRNNVSKLYGGQDIYGAVFNTGPLTDFINLLREGQPLGIFYGYLEDGYTEIGNIKYKDLNDDGIINSNDKTYIGNPNPKFIYGFNSVISYKGFDLTLFLQGSQGNDIFNLDANTNIDLGFGLNLPVDVYNNHWTVDNPNAKYPKLSKKISGNVSDRWVEDGSYLRLKNIQLAYNLPSGLIKWARSIQLYISGQNLFTINKFSWFDPEINSRGGSSSINQGLSYFGYPTAKSLTLGIRCSL